VPPRDKVSTHKKGRYLEVEFSLFGQTAAFSSHQFFMIGTIYRWFKKDRSFAQLAVESTRADFPVMAPSNPRFSGKRVISKVLPWLGTAARSPWTKSVLSSCRLLS
jgi:hypothetical protein